MKRKLAFSFILAAALLIMLAVPAFGADYSVTVTADPTSIEVGEVSTVTADYTAGQNGDNYYQWYVDGVAVGDEGYLNVSVQANAGQQGTTTYVFTGEEAGDFVITFEIWHDSYPNQSSRYAEDSETVTVTEPVVEEQTEEYKNHGQYVKSVAQGTDSGPGKGAVVSEAAKSDTGKKSK